MMHYSKLCLILSICCLFSINSQAQNDKKTWSVDVALSPIYTNRDLYGFPNSSNFRNSLLYSIGTNKQFNRLKIVVDLGYFSMNSKRWAYYSINGSSCDRAIGDCTPNRTPVFLFDRPQSAVLVANNFYFLQLQVGASYAFIKKKKWDLSIKFAYNPTIIIAQNYVVSNLQDGTISQRSANNRPKKENNSLLQFQTGLIFNYNLYKNISAFAEANFATISYEKNNFQYQLGTSLGLSYHF